jgi:hypothetical protein
MQMIAVENSSNIAAIGYEPSVNLLRVRYKDGRTYDFPDVVPAAHAALMAAPSKGKWLAANVSGGKRLSDALDPDTAPTPIPLVLREPQPPAERSVLNTIDPDDEGCCLAGLSRIADLNAINSWRCPKCGTEWRPNVVDGIRHWTARPVVIVW